MNSEPYEDEIILNDTFQTKRTSVYNLLLAGNNVVEELPTVPDKETFSFNVDNIHRISWEATDTETFGQYKYSSEKPLPTENIKLGSNNNTSSNNITNPGKWNLYYQSGDWSKYINGTTDCIVLPLERTKCKFLCEKYPGLEGGLFINDTTPGATAYFFREISNSEAERIRNTGTGSCTFTIGLLPIKVTGDVTLDSADPEKTAVNCNIKLKDNKTVAESYDDYVIDEDWFKTKFNSQNNFVTFGNYSPNVNTSDNFRFVLYFKTKFIPDTQSWEVHICDFNHNLICIVPDWDGLSFRTFRCDYSPESSTAFYSSIKAKLYLIKDGEEILLSDNIGKASEGGSFPLAPEFGSYSSANYSCLVIKEFNFGSDVNDSYIFDVDNGQGINIEGLRNNIKNEMRFSINDTTVDTNWEFMYNSNSTTGEICINDNWITKNDLEKIANFSKKDKRIIVTSDSGAITKFDGADKKVTTIDLRQLTNLTTLNLSDNLLQIVDLSKNIMLQDINLSGNQYLKKVILPKNLANNITINISNCPILTDIIFSSGNLADKIINIDISNSPNIRCIEIYNASTTTAFININTGTSHSSLGKLTLKNVTFDNMTNMDFSNFDNLDAINISEIALLKNKEKLELFLSKLRNRSDSAAGKIYLYGEKYEVNGVKGNTKDIAATLEILKNKNWLFFV